MLQKFISILTAAAIPISLANAAEPASNSTSVERRYCTEFGPFFIRFDPDKAAGVFAINGNNDLGAIVGALNGNQFEGEWMEVDSHGQIRITFADDWSSFDAEYNVARSPDRWRSGWTGHLPQNEAVVSFDVDGVTFDCR